MWRRLSPGYVITSVSRAYELGRPLVFGTYLRRSCSVWTHSATIVRLPSSIADAEIRMVLAAYQYHGGQAHTYLGRKYGLAPGPGPVRYELTFGSVRAVVPSPHVRPCFGFRLQLSHTPYRVVSRTALCSCNLALGAVSHPWGSAGRCRGSPPLSVAEGIV